jgi:hypothetical protein
VGITHSSVARLYERQADAYTTHGALGKAQKTVFEQLNWPGFPLQHSQQDSRGLQKVSNCKRALARKSFPSLKLSPVSAHPRHKVLSVLVARAEERKSGTPSSRDVAALGVGPQSQLRLNEVRLHVLQGQRVGAV